MFEITFLLLSLAIVFILLDLSISLKAMCKSLNILSNEYSTTEVKDDEVKTSYEIEKEIREKEFDARIKQLQDELSYASSKTPYNFIQSIKSTGTSADILADGIYNIPHNSIIPSQGNISEFAD